MSFKPSFAPAATVFSPARRSAALRLLVAKVPFALEQRALQGVLNKVFADARRAGELDFWAGKGLAIQLRDLNKQWVVCADAAGLRVCPGDSQYQARISGNAREFILLATREEDPDTLFFHRRLAIEGDTDLSLGVKNLIDSLEPLPGPAVNLLQGLGRLLA